MVEIESVHKDGSVIFNDGSVVLADVILHCTWYAPIYLTPILQGIGFILYEFQSKWIAGVLSGRIGLPSEEEMMRDIEALYFVA
ncbi:Flavin-containing monooxygenase FMO GS-OX5 [Vitis vinifera]|uniref:Flavin-containing monooxygenase FMO GS-OX5 n=1 Tax=Vitis vinifera TaxID=29760 RepID=A0A438K2V1_VITVI|nr:Flavin-containing monooxygenase FMO GS-OX5 [Vitis vinifera]